MENRIVRKSLRKPLREDWKEKLTEALFCLGITYSDQSGKVEINFNQGGITSVTLPQTLK